MPSVTIRVPDSLRASGYIPDPINTHVKERLTSILGDGTLQFGPAAIHEDAAQATFWINAGDHAHLADLAEAEGMGVSEIITALLVQDALKPREVVQPPAGPPCPAELHRALQALGLQERPEQSAFYRAIASVCAPDSPAQHRVLFAEAGTGTGKTLAYLVAAHRFAAERAGSPVAIAVPTHALIDQVLRDWNGLSQALATPIGPTVALLGQAEFVSATALDAILEEIEEPDVYASVRQWLDAGGPAPEGGVVPQRWTVAGLRGAAPGFCLMHSVTLEHRDSDEDPGYLAYRRQWDAVARAGVLVMTHAMLASLTTRRLRQVRGAHWDSATVREAIEAWGEVPQEKREERLYEVLHAIYAASDVTAGQELLPDLGLLIVDEAHQLEDAFSLVLSSTVSLWALRRDVHFLHDAQPQIVKGRDVQALDTIWNRLCRYGDEDQPRLGDELIGVIQNLSDVLTRLCASKRPRARHPVKWRRLQGVANALRLFLLSRQKYEQLIEVMLRWSPDRKWPQLTIGRMSHAREMHYLWTVVAARSCLVSATLYEDLPQTNCETAGRALHVPYELQQTMAPVHARWQYTPVTVCMVGPQSTADGRRPRFVRPRAEQDAPGLASPAAASHEAWVQDVSGYILQAHATGAGGMLALGTAFRDLAAIADALRGKTDAPILTHRAGLPLATLREQFLSLAEEGRRPILLAAGGAWTGFDLHTAREPNACTDLVILNAPFGAVTRTLAREVRLRRKSGFMELAAQMAVLVRTGIGRLVRSPDIPSNRRIHWLDGKIHLRSAAGMLSPVKQVFAKYRQVEMG